MTYHRSPLTRASVLSAIVCAINVAAPSCAYSQTQLGLADTTNIVAEAIVRRASQLKGVRPPQILFGIAGTKVFGGCTDQNHSVRIPGSYFCEKTNTIILEVYQLKSLRRAYGDGAVAYAIAHEMGHWFQTLNKNLRTRQQGISEELQADCLAGIILYTIRDDVGFTMQDVKEALMAAYSIGSPSHGSPELRATALKLGLSGDSDKCFPS